MYVICVVFWFLNLLFQVWQRQLQVSIMERKLEHWVSCIMEFLVMCTPSIPGQYFWRTLTTTVKDQVSKISSFISLLLLKNFISSMMTTRSKKNISRSDWILRPWTNFIRITFFSWYLDNPWFYENKKFSEILFLTNCSISLRSTVLVKAGVGW